MIAGCCDEQVLPLPERLTGRQSGPTAPADAPHGGEKQPRALTQYTRLDLARGYPRSSHVKKWSANGPLMKTNHKNVLLVITAGLWFIFTLLVKNRDDITNLTSNEVQT